MKRRHGYHALAMALCMVVVVTAGPAVADEAVTLTGTVTGLHQIVGDDGAIYQIGEGAIGAELGKLVGAKVKVTAGIEEAEGEKVLTVKSYEVVGQ